MNNLILNFKNSVSKICLILTGSVNASMKEKILSLPFFPLMRVLDRFLNYLRNKVRFGQCSKDCNEKENQFFSKKQNQEKGPIQVKGKLSRQNGTKFILHFDSRHLLVIYHHGCHIRELSICPPEMILSERSS